MSKKIEIDKLSSFSDDLVEFLKSERDINNLQQCLEQSKALQSQCEADYIDVQRSLQEYHEKIDVCKKKTDAAKSEVVADEEIDLLQKELEEEIQRESFLKEELSLNNTVISNDINLLERQRISIEERRKFLKKIEQDDSRGQMKLSMYASITNIIPSLDDQSTISGHIVDRDKKVVEKFESNPTNISDFDMCNNIWKMLIQ